MTDMAPSYSIIKEMANAIRQDRVASIDNDDIKLVSYQPFGKHWLSCFLKCHPKLITSFAHLIDAARVNELTEKQIKEWFIIVERILKEFNIDPKTCITWMNTDITLVLLKFLILCVFLPAMSNTGSRVVGRNGCR